MAGPISGWANLTAALASGSRAAGIYNILPYIEQDNLRNLGVGETDPVAKRSAMNQVTQNPLAVMICPSRRAVQLYPNAHPSPYTFYNCDRLSPVAKSDYAASGGDQDPCPCNSAISLAQGDDPAFVWQAEQKGNTGIINQRSEFTLESIRDGTSNTLMVGEKYLNPDAYTTGDFAGDDHSMYEGWDQDYVRWTFPPLGIYTRDRPGYHTQGFGGPHAAGAHFVFCDGSVRGINYGINEDTYRWLSNRADGQVISGDLF